MYESVAAAAGAPDFDPQAMMQELAGNDPRMAMLLQMMRPGAPQAVNNDDQPDERDELIAELGERLDAAEARLTKMTRIAHRLHDAHKADSERLQNLAAALGACGICWGDDNHCPGCRGRGRIGMVRPDLELRAELFGHDHRHKPGNERRHPPNPDLSGRPPQAESL